MLKKSKNGYRARFQIAGRDTEICLYQTNKRDAQRAHDLIDHEIKSKRIAQTLKRLLLEQCKALARKELDLEMSKGALAAIEALAAREALEMVEKFLPAPPITAAVLWQTYLSTPAARQLKESSARTKRQRAEVFIRWAGERDCSAFGMRDAASFLSQLSCGNATKRRYIADLSSIWQASPELSNPWSMALAEPEAVNRKEAFSLEEVRQLIASLEDNLQWQIAVIIAYYTGLRFKDVLLLRYDQIKNGLIELSPNKTERNLKEVSLKIRPELQAELDRLPLSIGYVLPELAALYNTSESRANRYFMNLVKRARLYRRGVGFHSLRHTFITEAIEAGVPHKDVQAAAGQASDAVTARYYHGISKVDLSLLPAL